MSIYPVVYQVKNPETGRKVKRTKFRVQIRTKELQINKLFDSEDLAKSYEKECLTHNPSLEKVTSIIQEMNAVTIQMLLKEHFNQTMSKQAQSSFKTNQNRCLSAIPYFKIPYHLIAKRIDKYKYGNNFMEQMLNKTFDFKNDGIDFGSFHISTVDFQLIIIYIEARKLTGIKDNTILRELSTISVAFDKIYKYFDKQFPDSVINPVKLVPRSEKPKQYLGRKRVLNKSESDKIAEWMMMKNNQEPYFVFIQCLSTGARKSEVLGIKWQNIDFDNKTIFLEKTKNGKSRLIMIDDSFYKYLIENKKDTGKVFKLTNWNFRQYWVDALKAMNMYDIEDRLHFHDTRRTAITKEIQNGNNNSFNIAKQFGVKPSTIEQEKKNNPQLMQAIFSKLKQGSALSEQEIMMLYGHSNIDTTQIYNGNRD